MGNKILSVFDFDHTLAKVDSFVLIKKDNKIVKRLNPAEFAGYELEQGEEFDFREFNTMLKNPKIIKRNFKVLVKQLEKSRKNPRGSRKVTILTARGLVLPIRTFFNSIGLNPYVVALGSGDPQHKADWIEEQISKINGYDTLYFMDDSKKNIEAVRKMLLNYPEVISTLKLVK